jgi:hypothetical protein
MSESLDTINYRVEEYNTERNYILIKPFSPLFKKSIETYPTYSVDISNLDSKRETSIQLAEICVPIIEHILSQEDPDQLTTFQKYLKENIGKLYAVPMSLLTPPRIEPEFISRLFSLSSTSTNSIPVSAIAAGIEFVN